MRGALELMKIMFFGFRSNAYIQRKLNKGRGKENKPDPMAH
jgi:hypothetical protein